MQDFEALGIAAPRLLSPFELLIGLLELVRLANDGFAELLSVLERERLRPRHKKEVDDRVVDGEVTESDGCLLQLCEVREPRGSDEKEECGLLVINHLTTHAHPRRDGVEEEDCLGLSPEGVE